MKRYDLNSHRACGSIYEAMDESADGEWCKFEDVESALKRQRWICIYEAKPRPHYPVEVIVTNQEGTRQIGNATWRETNVWTLPKSLAPFAVEYWRYTDWDTISALPRVNA